MKSVVFFCKFIHKVTNPLICHLNDNTYNANMKSEKLIKRRLIIMYKFMLNETSYHGAGAIKAVPEEN